LKDKLIKNRIPWRIAVYILGLLVLAFGVAFAINANLGVSPVASLPYVSSLIFYGTSTAWATVGVFTSIMQAFFILLQIAIQRKEFRWINLTQILFSTIFGFFVDFARWVLSDFTIPTYFGQFVMLIISIILISCGVVLFIDARLVPLPTEGFCLVVAQKFKNGKFHIVKIIFDCTLVVIGIVVSLLFLNSLQGIREGTVITALAIGKMIPYMRKFLKPILKHVEVLQEVQ